MTFVEADTQALPFAANTFQIVSVAFGLRNVADTDQGLREMTRVCRPRWTRGGPGVLHAPPPADAGALRLVLPPHPAADRPVAGAERPRRRTVTCPRVWGNSPNGPTWSQRMESAGLRDVRYYSLTGGIATLYVGVKVNDEADDRD